MHYAGTFTATGNTLRFDVSLCDVQFGTVSLQTTTVQYTATPNGLVGITVQGGHTVVINYALQ